IVNLATTITATGVEQVVYDGEAGGDQLTVVATSGNDVILHVPGAAFDEGDILVNSLLPLRYEDLGTNGTVRVDGQAGSDELVYRGTAGADLFTVAGGQIVLGSRLPVLPVAVERWRLSGLGGDDTFRLTAQANVTLVVEGDEPAGSDQLLFTGSGGAVTVDLGASTIEDGGVAGSPDVVYSGVELVEIAASGGAFTVVGT
ncbi:MAG: hypothetical protein RMJ16_15470, partial [Thermoguttaceae bacterium]|nr:hypothetical protein [Thermoguttaceae bacterium]